MLPQLNNLWGWRSPSGSSRAPSFNVPGSQQSAYDNEGSSSQGTHSNKSGFEDSIDIIGAGTRPLLELIDGLRTEGLDKDVSIPQIAVVGDQSSGKSSVLEALSGISFPRGGGLVTRCATELRLKTSTAWMARARISGEPESGKELRTLDEVGVAMAKLTSTLCKGKNFSTDSVIIDLHSPDVPNLTVVDLPGIVRNATGGQSTNYVSAFITQIDGLLDRYMSQPRTVILAVVPCCQDIATVEVLARAAKHDPHGERTIGVLTKPDLISPGSENEALQVLNNVTKPLHLGYVMVKNRSQQEISRGMSLSSARAAERSFFRNHPDVGIRQADTKRLGVTALASILNKVLIDRIKEALPGVRDEVALALGGTRTALDGLGKQLGDGLSEKRSALVKLTDDFCRNLRGSLLGDYTTEHLQDEKLRAYSKIYEDFKIFGQAIRDTHPCKTHTQPGAFEREIFKEQQAFKGQELPGFPSFTLFRVKASKMMVDWLGLSEEVVRVSSAQIHRVTTALLASPNLKHLNRLKTAIGAIADEATSSLTETVKERVRRTVTLESEEAFTMNDFFIQTSSKMRIDRFMECLPDPRSVLAPGNTSTTQKGSSNGRKTSDATSGTAFKEGALAQSLATRKCLEDLLRVGTEANEMLLAGDLADLLYSYHTVVSKRVIDEVCLQVKDGLLKTVAARVKQAISEQMCNDEAVLRIMEEDSGTTATRKRLREKEDRLSRALKKMHYL